MGLIGFLFGARNPYSQLAGLKVKDVMTKDVVTVQKEAPLTEAAHLMIGSKLSCLVVVDGQKPVGILTERDFIKKMSMEKETKKALHVADLMTKKVITTECGTSLMDAQKLMKSNNFRKLIIAEKDALKGILTQTDLCRAVARLRAPIVNEPLVRDIMTKKVLTANPDDSFQRVKKLMAQKDMGSVVITKKDEPMGIFTEFDVVSEYYFNPNRLKNAYLKDIITSPILCINADYPVAEANKYMLEKNFRRLPILEDGKLIGIITQTDVARALYAHIEKNKDARQRNHIWYSPHKCNFIKKGNIMLCEIRPKKPTARPSQ